MRLNCTVTLSKELTRLDIYNKYKKLGEDFRKIYSQKLQKEDFIHGIIASIHVSWNKFYVALCTVKANSLK